MSERISAREAIDMLSMAPPHVEIDPTGRTQHELGAKLDAGKNRCDLLLDFKNALKSVAQVATHGAEKYAPHSWIHVPEAVERYEAAMMRHLLEDGVDEDSKLDHLAHLAWNVLAVLELRIRFEMGERNDAKTSPIR